jgi:hypothetical protein
MMVAGFTVQEIAKDRKISTQCLKRHYRAELKNANELLKKYATMEYFEQAFAKGSVPALKVIAGLGLKAPAGAGGEVPNQDGGASPAARAEPVGKKEQRAKDAKDAAAGIFATPAPPKAAVSTRSH